MLAKIRKASERKRKMMVVGLIGVMVLIFFIIRFLASEDTWVCDDGQWIKHGNPSAPRPSEVCPPSIK